MHPTLLFAIMAVETVLGSGTNLENKNRETEKMPYNVGKNVRPNVVKDQMDAPAVFA